MGLGVAQDDDLPARAVENSLAVKQAEQKVAAAQARATGEHKALTMPIIDLASQYAYLAKYNNYDLYYRNYTANNFSGGLNIRFPIFNSVQKAKAEQADASALIAKKQVESTKNAKLDDGPAFLCRSRGRRGRSERRAAKATAEIEKSHGVKLTHTDLLVAIVRAFSRSTLA